MVKILLPISLLQKKNIPIYPDQTTEKKADFYDNYEAPTTKFVVDSSEVQAFSMDKGEFIGASALEEDTMPISLSKSRTANPTEETSEPIDDVDDITEKSNVEEKTFEDNGETVLQDEITDFESEEIIDAPSEKLPTDPVGVSDTLIEVSDIPIEVSETPVEVSDNPVESSDNPVEISDNPIEISDNPIEVSDTPIEVSDNPVEVSDNPVEVSDTPIEVSDNPIEVSDIPFEVSDNPIEVSDIPIEVSDNPVETSDNPIEVSNNPIEVSDIPVEISDTPIEGSNNPVEISDNRIDVTDIPIEVSTNPIEVPKNPVENIQEVDVDEQDFEEEDVIGNEKKVVKVEESFIATDSKGEEVELTTEKAFEIEDDLPSMTTLRSQGNMEILSTQAAILQNQGDLDQSDSKIDDTEDLIVEDNFIEETDRIPLDEKIADEEIPIEYDTNVAPDEIPDDLDSEIQGSSQIPIIDDQGVINDAIDQNEYDLKNDYEEQIIPENEIIPEDDIILENDIIPEDIELDDQDNAGAIQEDYIDEGIEEQEVLEPSGKVANQKSEVDYETEPEKIVKSQLGQNSQAGKV